MARRYYSSTAQRTTLASPLSSGATTMIVSGTTGFPGTRPYTLVIDPDTISEEIVTVTAASGTTLTVTRGEDGTTAVAHDLGATVWHGFTGRDLGEPQAHMDSSSGVHGRTGEVVGDTDTQTLSNKTMSGADNTFTDIPQTAVTDLVGDLAEKAPINSPTFTGNPVLPASTTLGDLSPTEISYLNGVTSNVQTQLDSKAPSASPSFTGTVSLPSTTNIGAVTGTEISRLAGVTANVQSQIDAITGGGVAVPPGGAMGAVLVKRSADDYDMEWQTINDLLGVAGGPGGSGEEIIPPSAWPSQGDTIGTYVDAYNGREYRYHKFEYDAGKTWPFAPKSITFPEGFIGTLLMVAGGGGSRSYRASGVMRYGGGSGGVYYGPYAFGTGTHNLVVGRGGYDGYGGTLANGQVDAQDGQNTYFDDVIVFGGGHGGVENGAYTEAGGDGGSGGGGDTLSGVGTGLKGTGAPDEYLYGGTPVAGTIGDALLGGAANVSVDMDGGGAVLYGPNTGTNWGAPGQPSQSYNAGFAGYAGIIIVKYRIA